eukprot:TRINITY_DN533_c0_g1_i1.p1 TRINITY_DN533_c0_g1~~TRINITY_DN533_c0_g1_i1.p1  ORF type:complete len:202 (-),score=55.53 TRINITY_DN533_c0_g1_i1:129-734(-)
MMIRNVVVLIAIVALVFPTLALAQGSCDCSTYDCGCCVDQIPLIQNICANVTWNAQQLSVTVDLSAGSLFLFTQTFTDTSPLSVCVSFTLCDQLCLQIANFNVTDMGACGTLLANVSCIGLSDTFTLGDFYLGYDCDIPSISSSYPIYDYALLEESAEETVEDGQNIQQEEQQEVEEATELIKAQLKTELKKELKKKHKKH